MGGGESGWSDEGDESVHEVGSWHLGRGEMCRWAETKPPRRSSVGVFYVSNQALWPECEHGQRK